MAQYVVTTNIKSRYDLLCNRPGRVVTMTVNTKGRGRKNTTNKIKYIDGKFSSNVFSTSHKKLLKRKVQEALLYAYN